MVEQQLFTILEHYFLTNFLRPRTQDSYRQVLEKFIGRLHEIELDSIHNLTVEALLKWRAYELREKGLSSTSWNTYCRTLRALFNHAVAHRLVNWPENHFNQLLVRTSKKRKKTLSPQQISLTYDLLNKLVYAEAVKTYSGRIHPAWFWKTVFETLYYTGIRRNQLLNIRLQDVCLHSGTIFLSLNGSKTHQEHVIPIPEELRASLTDLILRAKRKQFNGEDQLFNVTRFGKTDHQRRYRYTVMHDSNISNCFRELSGKLGFPISPHRLRHTLGTNLMRQPEKNLHLVKTLLGHSDIRTTLEYVEPDMEDVRHLLNTMPKLIK